MNDEAKTQRDVQKELVTEILQLLGLDPEKVPMAMHNDVRAAIARYAVELEKEEQ